jgi:Na+-translocating ferredoxin:NAD+ oxidoreductase RnfD subunit
VRFFRTPKGVVLIVLAGLTVLAVPAEGVSIVLPGLLAAVAAAAALDAVILRVRQRRWELPSGAILTALIVAHVLSSREPWWVVVVTALVAVASKYALRLQKANVFNPAAFALVATYYIFDTGQSWWGALPALPIAAIALLAAGGLFVAYYVNKLPIAIAFLGVWFGIVTAAAFLGQADRVAELFIAPDLHASIYFACFMVTDPPTSPTRVRAQIVNGAIVGVVAAGFFLLVGTVYYLLAGVLAANLIEAGRRQVIRARR